MTSNRQGSALLAVLWLSAALSAIAFSVASKVRAETEHASTTAEGTRAYFLATGALERAILWMHWGLYLNPTNPNGTPLYYRAPMPSLTFNMPAGTAVVEIIPESGKLNVNTAAPLDIQHVLESLGLDPTLALQLTAGILEWRSAASTPGPSVNFSPSPTFRPRRASLEELEELLLIPGMTPDIFYGRYDHDPAGRLIPRGGLRDCLTVWGQGAGKIDVNTAPPALLASVGIPPETVKFIVSRRLGTPFIKMEEVAQVINDPQVLSRLGLNGASIYTLRSTARARTPNSRASDLRRSVGAVVKLLTPGQFDPPFHVLRWYDEAWSPVGIGY